MIFDFLRNTAGAVRTVNRRFATPHLKMTPFARFSLGLLRFYLLFLVAIMVYKFIITLHR